MSYPYAPPPGYPQQGYPQQGYPPPGYPPPGRLPDDSTLDLLGVLFYVYAGLVALVGLGLGGVGVVEAVVASTVVATAHAPPAAAFGALFLFLFAGLGVLLLGKAVLVFFAGRALRGRTSFVLPIVAACLSLLNFPLGTALGVATLVFLNKPEVKARFRR